MCMLSAVDCGGLPPLPNGLMVINDTTFNSTASYSCDTGYELVGNTTRICQANGNWSGDQPSCLGKYLVILLNCSQSLSLIAV